MGTVRVAARGATAVLAGLVPASLVFAQRKTRMLRTGMAVITCVAE
jgi:hypothetical protein